MKLTLLNRLMYPESTTPTPSAAPPSAPQPDNAVAGHEADDSVDDGVDPASIDWAGMSEGAEGNEGATPPTPPAEPPSQPQTPPAQPAPAAAPATPPQTPAQPPAATPPAQPAQPQAQPQAQPAAPAAQPEPQAQPQPAPAQPAAETPEAKKAREQREAEEAAAFTRSLEEYYSIPEELAARLPTEPEKVLPVLAAKVHQAVLNGVQAWITQQLPAFLHSHEQVRQSNEATKNAFYERWPQLKTYEKQVLQVGRMYREMNPTATPEAIREKVGSIVCAALNVPVTAAPGGNGSQPPAPRQPINSPRPAGAGSSAAGAEPPADNIFTSLAESMLREDQDGR